MSDCAWVELEELATGGDIVKRAADTAGEPIAIGERRAVAGVREPRQELDDERADQAWVNV